MATSDDFNAMFMDQPCPQCGKQLVLNAPAPNNVETYGKAVVATTRCCDKAVRLFRTVTIGVAPYVGDKTTDDWGVPFIK